MNNVCLCIGDYAKTPYYVKVSDIYLYSIEELCYYFIDKVHLLDDYIVNMSLVKWIHDECGLTELADELEIYVRKKVSVSAFVSNILEKTGIYDGSVIKRVETILKEQKNMTPFERFKNQAQYLYKQGRFKSALDIYSELLDYVPESRNYERAVLYYNMASIYAMDFVYELAAEFYYKAYSIYPDRQIRVAYVLACRKYMTDYEYGNFKRENMDWENDFEEVSRLCAEADSKWHSSNEKSFLQKISDYKTQGRLEEYYKANDDLIKKLKSDYKRQTQV